MSTYIEAGVNVIDHADIVEIAERYIYHASLTYSEFDTLVNNVKELLDSVQSIPSINMRQATKDNLEQINRMYDECKYSMRTLQWIKEDLLKEDNKDA